MFEFAISHNQRQRPTKRLYFSLAASCLIHVIMLVVLIENPSLLRGGFYSHFRGIVLTRDFPEPSEVPEDEDSRIVAVLTPMTVPPADVLKDLIYDWDNPGKKEKGEDRTAQKRMGSEEENAPDENIIISTTIEPELEAAPAGTLDAADLMNEQEESSPDTGESPQGSPAQAAETAPKQEVPEEPVPLPVETTGTENEIALNTVPTRIPDSIPETNNTGTTESIRKFANEAQAISGSGPGIFDHQDFPLDEYANQIKELVTSNWYIPSNLRESKAYTTIIFYIDRNGQNFGTRIVESSGNRSLNLTALNAVINSNPFPPLPKNFPGDHVGVKYVFIPDPQ